MKKCLLSTTAAILAVGLMSAGAVAADKKMADKEMKAMKPSMTVNGFHNVIVGGFLEENDDSMPNDTSALDVRTNSEVIFNARGSLDNGVKIHARAELETSALHANSDVIDEYFLTLSGVFGQITVGALGGAPDKMLGGFTGTSAGVGSHPHFDNWFKAAGAAGTTYMSLDTGDAEKVTYISPNFGGFQVGLSYSPEMGEEPGATRTDADTKVHDGLEGAIRYSGKFGDVGFGTGAGMYVYQGANEDADLKDKSAWAVGGHLAFGGGFRVSATYKRVTDEDKTARSASTDVGVRYVQGANRFSLVGVHGEMENSDATRTTVVGGYARALGPGVVAHADLMWTSSQSDKAAGMEQIKADGTALLTGLKVSF